MGCDEIHSIPLKASPFSTALILNEQVLIEDWVEEFETLIESQWELELWFSLLFSLFSFLLWLWFWCWDNSQVECE